MPRVAPVNLTYNPKTLWFDPRDLTIAKGDNVVVETARGKEFGVAADDIFEVDESQLKSLKSPLKPVIRVATEQDKALADKLAWMPCPFSGKWQPRPMKKCIPFRWNFSSTLTRPFSISNLKSV